MKIIYCNNYNILIIIMNSILNTIEMRYYGMICNYCYRSNIFLDEEHLDLHI